MFTLIVRIPCFTQILPIYNDAKLYRECILNVVESQHLTFSKKGSNRLLADCDFLGSCGIHVLGLRVEALDFN